MALALAECCVGKNVISALIFGHPDTQAGRLVFDERRIRDKASNGGEILGLTAFSRYISAEKRDQNLQKMANIALTLPLAPQWIILLRSFCCSAACAVLGKMHCQICAVPDDQWHHDLPLFQMAKIQRAGANILAR